MRLARSALVSSHSAVLDRAVSRDRRADGLRQPSPSPCPLSSASLSFCCVLSARLTLSPPPQQLHCLYCSGALHARDYSMTSATASSASLQPVDWLVAVVAQRALLDDRLPSYLAILTESGFIIQQQRPVLLSSSDSPLLLDQGVEDDAAVFAVELPACVLLLQRVDAYTAFDSLREQLDFVYGSRTRWQALRDRQHFFPVRPTLERALLVIKPGYAQDDYAAVIDALEQSRFVILGKTGKILTTAEATQLVGEDAADVTSFTSDVSLFIALQRLNANTALTLLVGPPSVVEARTLAPCSLRARLSCSLYQSGSEERAAQDTRVGFGDGGFALERTVAVLGGRAREEAEEAEVMRRLREEGFTVVRSEEAYISRQRGQRLWRGRQQQTEGEDDVLTAWAASPCLALLLTKAAAVSHWQLLSSSLRCSRYVFASTAETVEADLRELFPLVPAAAALSSEEIIARFSATPQSSASSAASLQSVLTTGLIALCKAKPAGDEAVSWLAQWLLNNNPNQPTVTLPAAAAAAVSSSPSATAAAVVPVPLSAASITSPSLSFPAAVSGASAGFSMVWLIGSGDAAAEQAVLSTLVKQFRYRHVDVQAVLEAAVKNDSLRGLSISEYLSTARPLPSSLLVPLLSSRLTAEAETASVSPRLLLTGAPVNLDQAFAMEEAMGAVQAVMQLRAGGEKGETKREQDGRGDAETAEVLQHYRVFGKLAQVENGDATSWSAAVKRLLA